MASEVELLGFLRANWDAFYRKYRRKLPSNAWGNDVPDPHLVAFFSFAKPIAGQTALDVGCGHGKNTQLLVRMGLSATGVDFSKSAVDSAKRKVRRAKFLRGSARDLKFKAESFDYLIDAGCLHVNPIEERKGILKEYERVLKKDGLMFIRLFSSRSKKERLDSLPDRAVGAPGIFLPIWHCSRREAERLFSKKKWKILKSIHDKSYGPTGCYYFYLKKI